MDNTDAEAAALVSKKTEELVQVDDWMERSGIQIRTM